MSCPFNRVMAIGSPRGLITQVLSLDNIIRCGFQLMEGALTLTRKELFILMIFVPLLHVCGVCGYVLQAHPLQ